MRGGELLRGMEKVAPNCPSMTRQTYPKEKLLQSFMYPHDHRGHA